MKKIDYNKKIIHHTNNDVAIHVNGLAIQGVIIDSDEEHFIILTSNLLNNDVIEIERDEVNRIVHHEEITKDTKFYRLKPRKLVIDDFCEVN